MAKSVITEYMDYCLICGAPAECKHHLIEGTANRAKSELYGLTIPLCNACHNLTDNSVHGNTKMTALSKIIGQLAFERERAFNGDSRERAREVFRNTFGKSFV